MAYNSRSVILRSFCYRVKGMYWLDDLVAERDGGPKVKGCSLDLVSSYDGSATEGDDGGVGDKVSNYRNCLDDGGQLEVQRGTKITTLIPNTGTGRIPSSKDIRSFKDITIPPAPYWSNFDAIFEDLTVFVLIIRKSAPSELDAVIAEAVSCTVLATRGRYTESDLDFIIVFLATRAGIAVSKKKLC
ncbi:hypothetical protein GW17_00016984 [Ensete ventricosum]|nr:hypothetical protein GW17_00016984 [Ensete ventricosum]